MGKNDNNNALALSIAFAAVVIGGSIGFFGYQLNQSDGLDSRDLQAAIETGIEDYVREATGQADTTSAAATKPTNLEVDADKLVDDDAFIGNPDAPLTMVEFSDYQCPFCRMFYTQAYQEIKTNYVDTGKLKIVFRDFPLSMHADALPAAIAAECVQEQAGNAAYFKMHDLIFEGQGAPQNGTVAISDEDLADYAKE